MQRTDVAIVGAGQAGLAMSRCLQGLRIDHLVLDRGGVAERWRSLHWRDLQLLTPNWMTRLPGYRYEGPDPEGFMDRAALIRLLERYAAPAPVQTGTAVQRVSDLSGRYLIDTDRGPILARAVVIATGACDRPCVPGWAEGLGAGVRAMHSEDYTSPERLPAGGVLVVGASSTGVQIARALRAAGREVTLAAGRHTHMPRRYRGHDIFHWLDLAGVLADRWDQTRDLAAVRRQPSLQLSAWGSIDLGVLARMGVRVTGRVLDAAAGQVRLGHTLAGDLAAAEARCHRVLARIDTFVEANKLDAPVDQGAWRRPLRPRSAPLQIDLKAQGIGTVIFATGYRRDYGWLDLPVVDAQGELVHDGGVLPLPGLYALGLRFLRRRSSNFIDGVGRDAEDLSLHLADFLGHRRMAA
jgi:putative flavoprotein involved in K+ transport